MQERSVTVVVPSIPPSPGVSTGRRRRRIRTHLRAYGWLYALATPGLVYFATFRYGPMYGLVISFENYNPFSGITGSPWVGLENYQHLFSDPDFPRLLRNTLLLALLNALFVFPAPIIVALLLNELRLAWSKRAIQTAIYVPHFLSWAIVASLTYLLFAVDVGPLFRFFAGLTGYSGDMLGSPGWFRPLIIMQSLWKETGWGTIIYLAALAGVDPQLYEAAIVDGAGRFRRVWHVTLPSIRNTVVIMGILLSGNILHLSFEQIYLMTNAVNRSVADVFDTYVYYLGITQGAYSYATTMGVFKAVIGVILIFGTNRLAKRFDSPGLF